MGKNMVRIFLVDDHPVVREGLRRLLELEERIVVVDEASSAEETFGKVHPRSVDAVLMDVKLPGIDGIEATRQLKAKLPDLKVIILSSFGKEYLTQAIEAGADGYILKTTTQKELVQAVLQVAGGQSPIDPNLTAGLFGQFAKVSKLARHHGLSIRQNEILRLVAGGTPSKEIARRLAISDATFRREINSIFNFLGVNDRAHAIAEAYSRRLL